MPDTTPASSTPPAVIDLRECARQIGLGLTKTRDAPAQWVARQVAQARR